MLFSVFFLFGVYVCLFVQNYLVFLIKIVLDFFLFLFVCVVVSVFVVISVHFHFCFVLGVAFCLRGGGV